MATMVMSIHLGRKSRDLSLSLFSTLSRQILLFSPLTFRSTRPEDEIEFCRGGSTAQSLVK